MCIGAPCLRRTDLVRGYHREIGRDLRSFVEYDSRRGILLDILQRLDQGYTMGGAPSVFASQALGLLSFALRLAGLQVQGQRLLIAHRLECGDIVVQIAKVGAVGGALVM